MNAFFLTFMDKMEIFTGIKQMERLQAKPAQLKELVDECAKAAMNFPLRQEITEKVLLDAMQTDQDFIGLNVKWVRKVLNLYCQVHGVTKDSRTEEKIDLKKAYQDMIDFWIEHKDLDPNGERHEFANQNYIRVSKGELPVDDIEGIKIMAGMFQRQIAGTPLDVIVPEMQGGSGSKMKESLEKNGIIHDPKRLSALEESVGVTQEMKDKESNESK